MEAITIDLKKASELTGLSISTLRRSIRRRELNIVRLGRKILVPRSELEKLVRVHEEE